MLQIELMPILDSIMYWGQQFLSFILAIFLNPIIVVLIIAYFVFLFARWYIRRVKARRELEYLQKPSYESLQSKNVELEENLRALRRKIRNQAFKN